MIKELPAEQLDLVKQEEKFFNSHQRLFIKSLETFIEAQTSMSQDDIKDFIEKTKAIGASDFSEMINYLSDSKPSMIRVPIQSKETFFSATELAELCGVSVQLVRRECEKGNIRAERGIRNSWLIPEEELENPICKRWVINKNTMWSDIENAKMDLQGNEKLIERLKEIEESRKD